MAVSTRRIGVLTGGGDAPGLNAVIRAVVKTAINAYGWEVLGIEDGFEGLIQPAKVHPLSLGEVRGILPRGGTILGTTNRANPFKYEVQVIGADGGREIKEYDVSGDVLRRAQVLGMDALVVIGGDGSLHIANELMLKGLPVVGVPKTIDNDLEKTEITFGFDTALNTAMEALDRLHTTAKSHHRVIILEVMGRDTGWIALEAGISGGADVILIPEIPFDLAAVVEQVEQRNQRGAKFSIIVVAEGAYPQGKTALYRHTRELGAAPRLGGIGETLRAELQTLTEAVIRVTVLGHLQTRRLAYCLRSPAGFALRHHGSASHRTGQAGVYGCPAKWRHRLCAHLRGSGQTKSGPARQRFDHYCPGIGYLPGTQAGRAGKHMRSPNS